MQITEKTSYRGARYWIEGTLPTRTEAGLFWYFIDRNGQETKSEHPFESASAAGAAARKAIETWSALKTEPEKAAPKGRRKKAN